MVFSLFGRQVDYTDDATAHHNGPQITTANLLHLEALTPQIAAIYHSKPQVQGLKTPANGMRGVAETPAESGGLLCGIAVYRAKEGLLGGTTGSCGAGARAGGRVWDKNSGKGTSDA